eukprot:m.134415 g.134415  ORF g.134415 m.134415 type:complete len:94 (-) comp13957_c0_seq5:220-501(-)
MQQAKDVRIDNTTHSSALANDYSEPCCGDNLSALAVSESAPTPTCTVGTATKKGALCSQTALQLTFMYTSRNIQRVQNPLHSFESHFVISLKK